MVGNFCQLMDKTFFVEIMVHGIQTKMVLSTKMLMFSKMK